MGRLEAVLPLLPAVLALSANSPYADGAETGLASTRAELLQLLPRAGAPPAFDSYEEFLAFAELLVKLELADDLMRLWWDVRPHPRLGTLEIRAPDQPTRLADTAALAGLCHALVVAAHPTAARADRGLYAQNRWAAARFGAQAGLIHPETRKLTTPQELLGGLDGLDQSGEQLAIGRSDGLRALRERLVTLTYDQL
jgi:carboxylate-amine ligase